MSPKPVLVIKPTQRDSSNGMKILFTTDGSDHARKAGETLSLMPFHDDTEITILHVITPAFYDVPDKFMSKIDVSFREDLKRYSSLELQESQRIIAQASEYLTTSFEYRQLTNCDPR
jgi:hypothetical protein